MSDPKLPRVFASPAYLSEPEPGLFRLRRDVLVETDGPPDAEGNRPREKMGKAIELGEFRIAQLGERADFTTSRPDGTVLLLVRLGKEAP